MQLREARLQVLALALVLARLRALVLALARLLVLARVLALARMKPIPVPPRPAWGSLQRPAWILAPALKAGATATCRTRCGNNRSAGVCATSSSSTPQAAPPVSLLQSLPALAWPQTLQRQHPWQAKV